MRGETLERLRRRATRKWIPALGRGVVGAGNDWTEAAALPETLEMKRLETQAQAGMATLTSWPRTLASTRLLLHLTANIATSGQNHVFHLHAANEQHNHPQR